MNAKKCFFAIGLVALYTCITHSQNLLLNGNFEQYDLCPATNADFCAYWQQIEIGNSMNSTTAPACAYYHTCAGNYNHPFFNQFGYQEPHSGAGFVSVNVGAFYQELAQPLITGRFYTLSLFVNIPNNRACVLNQYSKIGLYATANRMPDIIPQNVTAFNHTFQQFQGIVPKVLSNEVIKDTANWVLVSGCFRAEGDERFITVALSSFDELQSCPMIYNLVYFVDDVSLTLNTNPDTIQVETKICKDTKAILSVTQSITDVVGSAINCDWADGYNAGSERPIQSSGTYIATVHTNCESHSVQFNVTEKICDCQFYAPNVIKVNNSGWNDTFQPQFACQNATIEKYQLRIFDRWGNLVFFTYDKDQYWDGRFSGRPVEGVVSWMIQYVLSASSISEQKIDIGDLLIMR